MKSYLLLFLVLLFISCGTQIPDDNKELQELYSLLDSEIARSKVYEEAKEAKISKLHKDYNLATNEKHKTKIINDIIAEFEAYNADSTLYYIGYNLQRTPKSMTYDHNRLLIKRANVFAHAGLFSDALSTMGAIKKDSLKGNLPEMYFSTYCAIYQYLSEYTSEHESASGYDRLRSIYADSLSQVKNLGLFNRMIHIMTEKARNGEADKAIEIMSEHLKKYESGSREYSILASTMAYIYKTSGQEELYKQHLVLSAISDVRGAVKENMSFRELATVMFEAGDIERANRYLKKSIADANFYSTLLRNAQSSKILPIIDDAYASLQDRLMKRLRYMALISSVLSAFLIMAICYMLKQFKSLRTANRLVRDANNELSEMSRQLKDTNAELHSKNKELSNLTEALANSNKVLETHNIELNELSNQLKSANKELAAVNDSLMQSDSIKEQYAGLFMQFSSLTIRNLENYHQKLHNLAVKGNMKELVKKIEGEDVADQILKDFYRKFDDAILNIYPDFVVKINVLLQPEQQLTPKPGSKLNTELRILALIRLGMTDSEKIAGFLRCSLTTIYTYRSKIRKRAINPDSFEEDILL